MVLAATRLTPARYAVLCRRANLRGVTLAVLLREYLDPAFRETLTATPSLPA